ncbi:MAG TPA: DNA polymerase III subunit delta [Dehalococcoidia bacterium]|nr:DNA polymerase III subunit delta [Dehalococcoidia bacterium]
MVYILYGEDNFSIHEAIQDIKRGLGDPDLLAVNTTWLEGKQLSAGELSAVCQTMPFLAPKRLIIVEGLAGRFEAAVRGRRGRRPAPPQPQGWQAFAECIQSVPDHAVLVLVDDKLEATNPLLRALSPWAEVREYRPLRGERLVRWIEGRVAQAGGRMAPPAVRKLAELVGPNLWALSAEIEKLLLYADGRRVELADVSQVSSYAREADVFSLVDALLGRDMATAGRELHHLLASGATPPYLLFMIARQLRLLILARELVDSGGSRDKIGQRLDLTNPFILDKTIDQARRFSLERLTQVYGRLLEADIAIKTGHLPGETALELFLAELSPGGEPG